MDSLDGKKIVNNIYAKAKELEVKIGDIEKEIPVSVGYFSRFLKDDNHSIPSIESLHVAANKLNVTIDFLLFSNFTGMNEEELLIQEKISALCLKTKNGTYNWNEISEKVFYAPIRPENGYLYAKYPFAIITKDYTYNDKHGLTSYSIEQYFSLFLDKILTLNGSIYCLKINSYYFYFSKIVDSSKKDNDLYYELYVNTPIANGDFKLHKLVNASSKDKFFNLLDELYKTCVFKSQEFKLDAPALDALYCI